MKLRCWAPIEFKATELPDGSVEVEHKVLVYGEQKQRDRAGKMRTFNITPQVAAEMVANCERDGSTDYQAPVFIGHPDDRSTEPAVGWVQRLRAASDGLYALVRYLPAMAQAIRDGAFRYISPTFTFAYEDQHGVERGAKFLDLGVLNTPHQKDTGSIPLSDVAFALSEVAACEPDDSIRHDTAAGDPMDEDKVKALVAAALAEFAAKNDEKWTARFAELADTISKKAEPPAAMAEAGVKVENALIELGKRVTKTETALAETSGKLAKAEKDLAAAETENAENKRVLSLSRIEGLITDGMENGTLEAKDVPGFGTDAFDGLKWLAESKFNGERGLRTHVATSSPVVAFEDRRRSAPTAKGGDRDVQLSEVPTPPGFANRDEFERFANMGTGGDPRHVAR